jgi:hypothetical protein
LNTSLIQRFSIRRRSIGRRLRGRNGDGGKGWPGGYTQRHRRLACGQFQPCASKSCQLWLVSWPLGTTGVASVAVLAGRVVGMFGLAGVWLHAAATAQAATTAANGLAPRRSTCLTIP